MKRTGIFQEIRKMQFEEAYSVWTERRLDQEETARILGVCTRTFRRYIDRYEESGMEGLLDKRLTQASSRRAPVDEVMALARQYGDQLPKKLALYGITTIKTERKQKRKGSVGPPPATSSEKLLSVYDFRSFYEQYNADSSIC